MAWRNSVLHSGTIVFTTELVIHHSQPELTWDDLYQIWNVISHWANSLTLLIKVNVYFQDEWIKEKGLISLKTTIYSLEKQEAKNKQTKKSSSHWQIRILYTFLTGSNSSNRLSHFCFFLVKVFEGFWNIYFTFYVSNFWVNSNN